MMKESIDMPVLLIEMIGKSIIRSVSEQAVISQKDWKFDMFLEKTDSKAYILGMWILQNDRNTNPKCIRVNFNYSLLKNNYQLASRINTFLSYYKLDKDMARTMQINSWEWLKSQYIVEGITFDSWLKFFEQSYPKDYKFYILNIIKHMQ